MFRSVALTSVLALSVSGCDLLLADSLGFGNYCEAQPHVCALVGFVLAGALFAQTSGSSSYYYYSLVSDERVKTDIRPVGRTDSGIALYAFRYRGSEQQFVGPLAGELQRDPRFAHAVSTGADGYLRVNLAALGLGVVNGEAMARAGERAARQAVH